jgi:hypothetical protein
LQMFAGDRTHNLQDNLMKLKVVYAFVEQLYARSIFTIKSAMGEEDAPQFIRDVLK